MPETNSAKGKAVALDEDDSLWVQCRHLSRSLAPSVCLCLCLCLRLSLSLSLCVCLSTCKSIYESTYLHLYLSSNVCLYISIFYLYVSIRISIST